MIRPLFAILLLLLTACSNGRPGDATRTARESQDPRAALIKRKCISCHTPPRAADFSDEKWLSIMEEHGKRMKLSEEDRKKLFDYLTENN